MFIRRCKKRINVVNDARIKSCIARYDSGAHGAIGLKCGAYTRVQFLHAVSHSVGAHAVHEAATDAADTDDDDDQDANAGFVSCKKKNQNAKNMARAGARAYMGVWGRCP